MHFVSEVNSHHVSVPFLSLNFVFFSAIGITKLSINSLMKRDFRNLMLTRMKDTKQDKNIRWRTMWRQESGVL